MTAHAQVFTVREIENILTALQTARPDGAGYFELVRIALGIDADATPAPSWSVSRQEARRIEVDA